VKQVVLFSFTRTRKVRGSSGFRPPLLIAADLLTSPLEVFSPPE